MSTILTSDSLVVNRNQESHSPCVASFAGYCQQSSGQGASESTKAQLTP